MAAATDVHRVRAIVKPFCTAFTRSALHTEFRLSWGSPNYPGVLAIADIGRTRLYMVRSLDREGRGGGPVRHANSPTCSDTLVFDPATYPAFAGPGSRGSAGLLGKGEVAVGGDVGSF